MTRLTTMGSLSRCSRRLARPAARQFSTSPSLGVRAIFAQTDNAQLNAILTTIQEKIILPSYLPKKQREMVFNPKMRTHLEQNPVVIEVEGLEHKFSTIDRFKGVENSKTILNRAIENMRSPEDWANLGTLLAGYRKAGIKLKADIYGKLVRSAGKTGNIFAAVECAKQADETGLRLNHRENVAHVFSSINEKVAESRGDAAVAGQALKSAELVLDLLHRPAHSFPNLPTRERLHFSPVNRGMILFARASSIKARQEAGETVEQQDLTLLQDDVDLLISLWKDLTTQNLTDVEAFAKLNPTVERNSSPKGVKVTRALNGGTYLKVMAQNIKGLSLAREILGEAAQGLVPAEVALSNHLKEFVQTATSSTEGWREEYQKIAGHEPQW